MKKLRSLIELTEAVDYDLSKRKRALTSLKFAVAQATPSRRQVVAQSAVCLLYGHWEGFIKYAGTCYTNYVSHLGLPYKRLSNGVVSICVRSQIRGLKDTRKIGLNREFVDILRDQGEVSPQIPWKSAIETYDNLNTDVLIEVLMIIGCEPAEYKTRRGLIDEKLLRHRNRIAHEGYDPEFDDSEYEAIHVQIVELIENVRDDIENAATLRRFEREVEYRNREE